MSDEINSGNENPADKTPGILNRIANRAVRFIGPGTGAVYGCAMGTQSLDPSDHWSTMITKPIMGAGIGLAAGTFMRSTVDAIDDNTTVQLQRLEEERRRNAEQGGDNSPKR